MGPVPDGAPTPSRRPGRRVVGIDAGRFAADINFELGNVWGKTSDVIIYGRGKSELDDWLEAGARTQGRTVRGEQDVKAGWFYRSDQISFARVVIEGLRPRWSLAGGLPPT